MNISLGNFQTHSESETYHLAERIGRLLEGGEVLALYGPMGAGKTQFVKGLASSLGIDSHSVTSPTYTLIQEYRGKLNLIHIDAYRLKGNELDALGLEEYFNRSNVVVIEWPEKAENSLPESVCRVNIEFVDDQTRNITIL